MHYAAAAGDDRVVRRLLAGATESKLHLLLLSDSTGSTAFDIANNVGGDFVLAALMDKTVVWV